VELRRTDVAGIAALAPLPALSYDKFDADAESDDLLDLGWAKGKSPTSLKQTEFTFKEFAKTLGQPIFSAFSDCNIVWVAGCLGKKNWYIIPGQTRSNHMRDGPLQWGTAVVDVLETLKPGCLSKISIKQNGFSDNGWGCF
jgi:hypothetical protein